MEKLKGWAKSYLDFINLKREDDAKEFGRFLLEAFLATVYMISSAVLIASQIGDLVVLALNIICVFRSGIRESIKASIYTESYQFYMNLLGKRFLEVKRVRPVLKAGIILAVASMFSLDFCICWFEPGSLSIKIHAIASIVIVWLVDLDNAVIDAFHAEIRIVTE